MKLSVDLGLTIAVVLFVCFLIFWVISLIRRKKSVKEPKTEEIKDLPSIQHVDWVARKAFIISSTGVEYVYDFRFANNTIQIGDYSLFSSNDGLSIFIERGDTMVSHIKNPKC